MAIIENIVFVLMILGIAVMLTVLVTSIMNAFE